MPSSRPPAMFGPYALGVKLAEGGMASVFRAVDTRTDRTVAIKRVLPHVAADEEFLRMFEDEGRIAEQLSHPHIARCLELGVHGGTYFIAYEFVEGRTLRELWKQAEQERTQVPLPFLTYVFSRLAEGLDYAHARRDASGQPVCLVHRDVTPHNIMVSFAGDVKLIDFGIAKAKGRLSETQAGTLKGKFAYMSPEQIAAAEIDHRTDIFSWGVSFWELLTLRRLFTAPNEIMVLEKVVVQPAPPPSAHRAEIPRTLDEIVLKSLAKSKDQRYGSAREVYQELNAFSARAGITATREEIAQTMRERFVEPSQSVRVPAVRQDAQAVVVQAVVDRGPRSWRPQMQQPQMQQPQETGMADENKGADLDIFEGLGKKKKDEKAPVSAPPPPPRSSSAMPTAKDIREAMPKPEIAKVDPKKTMMGHGAPPSQPPGPLPPPSQPPMRAASPSMPPATQPSAPPSGAMSPSKVPPPPPGRASLPPIAGSAPAPAAGAPTSTGQMQAGQVQAPPTKPAGGKPGIDMDWDDEDEATHVFDKEKSVAQAAPQAPGTSPSPMSPSPTSPGATSQGRISQNPEAAAERADPQVLTAPARTLVGINGAPNSSGSVGAMPSAPPAPPGAAGPSSVRPPTSVPAPPPPPAPPQPGPNSTRLSAAPPAPPGAVTMRTSVAPPPPPPARQSMPPEGQTTTAPMPMPHRPSSFPPPAAGMPSYPPGTQAGPMPSYPPPGSVPPASLPPASLPPASLPPQSQMGSRSMEATQMVRAQSSEGGGKGPVVVLGIGLIAIAAGAGVFLAMPRTGKLVVNVADAKGAPADRVEVFVDGKKQCDTSPCTVDQLSAGEHQIKVIATGADPLTKTATVESRGSVTADFTLPALAAKGGTGLRVSGNQPGVKLFIDGREIGALPQEVKDLTPGDHKIRVAGSERYAALEKNVIIGKDEMQDLGPMTLKVVKGKITVQLQTPGAKVYLVSGGERKEVTPLPLSIDPIDPAKSWAIEASKAGFSDFKQAITFDDGQAEKTINVTLDSKTAAATTAATPATPGPQTAPATPTPQPATQPTTPKPAPAEVATGEAFLNINSIPASSVVLDGKPLGPTPQLKVKVSPGTHSVLFVNAEQGLKKSVQVSVGSGETKAAFAKLKAE
jgi:serine/threonine protein kinase